MKWYKYLYVGESLKGKEQKIKAMITENMMLPYAHVITLPANPQNLMDVIAANELRKKNYPKESMRIIGIAGDRAEALELVRQIVDEAYKATGKVNIPEFLLTRFQGSKDRGGAEA